MYRERCLMVYMTGRQGRGKTDLAHLMAEVIEHRSHHATDLQEAEIVSNIPSSGYRTIDHYPRFVEWVQSGAVEENRWFIFDEASSELTGYSKDQAIVEELMSELVKKMRKNGVNLILIGHTGMDLHARPRPRGSTRRSTEESPLVTCSISIGSHRLGLATRPTTRRSGRGETRSRIATTLIR
jgi:hypothetical protein